ncbi:hypothetical protein [Salinibacterium sp. ZJ77]|uniref:hypothetical protein n=1 Tax=Salinibacterium sp. ZJ77 TaxID=2708337 RepID=UPI001422E104|nr:hypothetical protein [Salinibacterium sp. ZJ77]
MTSPRRLAAAVVLVCAALLTGCTSDADTAVDRTSAPTPTAGTLPPAEIEAMLAELLPAAPDGFEVVDTLGLDTPTVGADWTSEDYDASRIARAARSYDSPGWSGLARGPGFVYDVEIMVLSSADRASLLMTDLASSARTPFEETEEGVRVAYSPLAAPSGLWPFGTVEYMRDVTWQAGERASGPTAFYAAGPVVLIVSWLAVPESEDAAAAHVAEFAPALVEAVAALPDRLERPR